MSWLSLISGLAARRWNINRWAAATFAKTMAAPRAPFVPAALAWSRKGRLCLSVISGQFRRATSLTTELSNSGCLDRQASSKSKYAVSSSASSTTVLTSPPPEDWTVVPASAVISCPVAADSCVNSCSRSSSLAARDAWWANSVRKTIRAKSSASADVLPSAAASCDPLIASHRDRSWPDMALHAAMACAMASAASRSGCLAR
mmetsp:Transcript_38939/g.110423  ORF Transcript_38939/g.110423 Transcript_38939/m.110423 type:complete len:203 (-) Transcript_38939:237-845(-)